MTATADSQSKTKPSDEQSTQAARWTLETVPTSIGHCHKIKIDPEGLTSRGPQYDDALVACVYVDHRDAREKDRRTLVAAERARLIAAAPKMLAELRRARAFITQTTEYKRGDIGAATLSSDLFDAIAKAEGR